MRRRKIVLIALLLASNVIVAAADLNYALIPIQKALDDQDRTVREKAAKDLAMLAAPEADRLVVSLLLDPDPEKARLGTVALSSIAFYGDGSKRPYAILTEAIAKDRKRVVLTMRQSFEKNYLMSQLLAAASGFADPAPLVAAVQQDDGARVQDLVDQGADVNARSLPGGRGTSVLGEASLRGYGEIVELLLLCKANVNLKDDLGMTPLCYAAREGNLDVSRTLLKHGANVMTGDNERNTPLIYAVKSAKPDIVLLLLQSGADPLQANLFLRTAADLAVELDRLDFLRPMLSLAFETGRDDERIFRTAAEFAVRAGDTAKLTRLFAINHRSAVYEQNGISLLLIAVEKGNLEAVSLLVKEKVDIQACDASGTTPLLAAVVNGRDEIARFLLSKGAGENTSDTRGESVLAAASRLDRVGIAKLLLQWQAKQGGALDQAASVEMARLLGAGTLIKGVPVLSASQALADQLRAAVKDVDVPRVEELLTVVNVNTQRGSYGSETALLVAAAAGNLEMVKRLVAKGANVNQGDLGYHSETYPVEAALGSGNWEVVDYLLSKRAALSESVNSASLNRIFEKGGANAIRSALKKGPLTVKGQVGDATFLAACRQASMELVKVLVEAGANVNAFSPPATSDFDGSVTKGREDALSVAIGAKRPEVAQYLLTKGAKPSESAAIAAIMQGYKSLATSLLKGGSPASVNVLVAACEVGDIGLVMSLLSIGAKVNARSSSGQTPVEAAHLAGHEDIVDLLVRKGATISW